MAPWTVIAPGIAIFVAVMIFNLLGDTIRDFMDPTHRNTAPGGQGWLRRLSKGQREVGYESVKGLKEESPKT